VTRGEKGALCALVLLALFLRLWPVAHGMPRGYVPDGHVVRNALGMARDKDPIPPAGRYSSYPYLVPYLLLPVYAGRFVAGRAGGEWGGVDEFGQRAMEEPGIVQVPARALIGVLGALSVLAVFGAARAAGMKRGAWVASWLAATCLLNVHLSTHERPWVALVFFAALSLWAAVRYGTSGRGAHLAWSGVCAGLAFACHQAGLTILAFPATAWLLGPLGWSGEELKVRLKSGALCVLLFLVVSVLLGHPYYLRHGATSQEAVVGGELAADKVSIGGQAVNLGVSLQSVQNLSRALFGYDPVLLVLGLSGVFFALRRRALRAPLLALLLVGGFFLTNPSDHVRYLLPVCLLLTLPAAALGERLLGRTLGTALLVPLLALPLVQSLRLGWVLRQEDTRARAERTLDELPPGSVVAIDHYGPRVDLSLAGFQRLFEIRELYAREHHRAQRLQTEDDVAPGLDAIQVEDLFELDPSGAYVVRERAQVFGATPRDVLRALGVTHLVLVKRVPREPDEWLQGLADGGRVVESIDPSGTDTPPLEAFLPTEMRFPLSALWAVRRPGPRVEVVELLP
jgi:hypothetical protein